MPSFSGLNPVLGLSDGLNLTAFTAPGGQNPNQVLAQVSQSYGGTAISWLSGQAQQPPGGDVLVSYSSPPISMKMAVKIWNGDYTDLNLLLSYRLGAPEPSLVETLQGRSKEGKQITSIQQ